MLDIPASDYKVSVLEVAASSSASIEVLAKMKARWKQKVVHSAIRIERKLTVPTVARLTTRTTLTWKA